MQRLAALWVSSVLLLAMQTLAAPAAADNADILEEECNQQLNLGASGCQCIGEQAEDVLSDKQQGLVVAMVTKDNAAAAALRDQMTVQEITGAANFMMEAPNTCAAQ